jgi:hypothetical protein
LADSHRRLAADFAVTGELEAMMNQVKNIRIMCPIPKCRSILVVPETARGKSVKCGHCTALFKIPSQSPVPIPVLS